MMVAGAAVHFKQFIPYSGISKDNALLMYGPFINR